MSGDGAPAPSPLGNLYVWRLQIVAAKRPDPQKVQ